MEAADESGHAAVLSLLATLAALPVSAASADALTVEFRGPHSLASTEEELVRQERAAAPHRRAPH